jgi:hypothetical protein
LLDLGVCVGAVGVGVEVDHWMFGQTIRSTVK